MAANVALGFGVFPMSFFFRMAYSESLFVFILLLVLYGIERKWPVLIVAALVGFLTATRPMGMCAVPCFMLYVWRQSESGMLAWGKVLLLLPMSMWGILVYISYKAIEFGEPLAFMKTQALWGLRAEDSMTDKLVALGALEPLWAMFDPSSACYLHCRREGYDLLFSPCLANRVFSLAVVVLVGIGAWKRWLSAYELILASGLVFLPYATKGYDVCMGSMGRYSAAVVPCYLVLGKWLSSLPPAMAAVLVAISAFFMGVYAGMFSCWYPVF